MDDCFKNKALEILEERSIKETTRMMFPRGVKEAGGFSDRFLRSLRNEVLRIRSENEKVQNHQILKALDFELREIE